MVLWQRQWKKTVISFFNRNLNKLTGLPSNPIGPWGRRGEDTYVSVAISNLIFLKTSCTQKIFKVKLKYLLVNESEFSVAEQCSVNEHKKKAQAIFTSIESSSVCQNELCFFETVQTALILHIRIDIKQSANVISRIWICNNSVKCAILLKEHRKF